MLYLHFCDARCVQDGPILYNMYSSRCVLLTKDLFRFSNFYLKCDVAGYAHGFREDAYAYCLQKSLRDIPGFYKRCRDRNMSTSADAGAVHIFKVVRMARVELSICGFSGFEFYSCKSCSGIHVRSSGSNSPPDSCNGYHEGDCVSSFVSFK